MIDRNELRRMRRKAWAEVGMPDFAYVKKVEVGGTAAFAIHAADGTELAVFTDRDVACAAVRQNEMVPMSVH